MINIKYLLASVFLLCSCHDQMRTDSQVAPADVVQYELTTEPWKFGNDKGVLIQTESWSIYTTLQYDHVVSQLPRFYDSLITLYASEFGSFPYPTDRLVVYLFATEEQWRRQVQVMLGNDAKHWFQLGRGGLTIDGIAVLYDLDSRGRSRTTLRIAAHEGWHQYAEAVFADPLPTWLDEGIGTWMEGFRLRRGELQFEPENNWDRLSAIRKIVNADRLTPLSELLGSDPAQLLDSGRSTLLGYYAQLWGFISFLMETDGGLYRPVIQKILQDAVQGELQNPNAGTSWLHHFAESPKQFETKFQAWLKEYVRPGSTWR